jgi:hypothetical protein
LGGVLQGRLGQTRNSEEELRGLLFDALSQAVKRERHDLGCRASDAGQVARRRQRSRNPLLTIFGYSLMPTHLRVLVSDVSPMLGDIVRDAIAREPALELLPAIGDSDIHEWRRTDPDVIILSTPDIQQLSSVGDWLNRCPRARIVVIETSGREAVLYELQPSMTPLGALSPEQLIAVIRDPAGE